MSAELADRHIRTDIKMSVAARDRQIHLLFSEDDPSTKQPRPAYTANFLMSAEQALAFATLVADLAFEADTGLKAAGPAIKAELADRHRSKLTARLSVILNSTREKKTINNRSLARQLVDVMLSEVLA